MAETITLPAVGPVPRNAVIAGGGALVGLVGLAYWRRYRALEAADEGVTYGEGFDEFGNLLGEIPYQTSGPSGLFEPDNDTPGDGFNTNAQWTQAAVDYLERIGIQADGAGIALGKYLAAQRLTATEAQWVRAALGGVGEPPRGGPYVVLVETAPPAAAAPPSPTGLRLLAASSSTLSWGWDAVAGAAKYRVRFVQGLDSTIRTSETAGLRADLSGLQAGQPYRVYVAAVSAEGKAGEPATLVSRTTGAAGGKGKLNIRDAPSRTAIGWMWDRYPGAAGYSVSPEIAGKKLPHRSVTGPGFSWSGLQPGHNYAINVVAYDAAGKEISLWTRHVSKTRP